jgi:thiol-disulfide isomerase/thioredoxin
MPAAYTIPMDSFLSPDFVLTAPLDKKKYSLECISGAKGTLLIFMCNHCPYVLHILPKLIKLIPEFQMQGIGVAAISSNDISRYPDDSPDKMAVLSEKWTFPYLFDEDQSVAKAYHAACTPDFVLMGKDKMTVYRGQFDNSRPGNPLPVTGSDLSRAIYHLVNELPPLVPQIPSIGCSIKWFETD